VTRNVFSYRRVAIDVGVERARFPVRPLSPAESASTRALFHAAMRRPVETRAAIAEARKADPKAAESFSAEGLLLDREQKYEEAKAAYAKAVELGTTSAYVHYRLASLVWQPMPSKDVLQQIEALLSKAINCNTRYAAAYSWLGDVRTSLGMENGIGLIRRAIALEPREARHRLRVAGILLFQGKPAEARVEAQTALTLAEGEDERREAQELLNRIAKATAGEV
jgi:tetratricopeptide (TPR) repeat protein